MDDKGFISIEYMFCFFIILIVATGLLFFSTSLIESGNNFGNNVNHRLVLDNVANSICQVNSKGDGYSKLIELPSSQQSYKIIAEKGKLTIQAGSLKGQTQMPLVKLNSKYELYGGNSYLIEKNDGKIVIK